MKRNGSGIALLADETRRQIVALLALGTRRPSALAREVGISRPAMSRQLHLLEEAGLIRAAPSWIDGRGKAYSLDPGAHRRITAWLAGTGVGLEAALRTTGNHGEEDGALAD